MTDLGRFLEMLRLERRETLTEFAKAAGLSHALLSAIAYGRKHVTPYVIERLRANLGMDEGDLRRLQVLGVEQRAQKDKGAVGREESFPATILVPADRLIRREARGDVREVRVIDPSPQEEFDSAWRKEVVKNLRNGCRYTYFVSDPAKVETINLSLHEGLEEAGPLAKEARFNFVIVPYFLQAHFFRPARVVYQPKAGPIEGYWVFRDPRSGSQFDQLVMPMDQETAQALWAEYGRILHRLQAASLIRPGVRQSQLADSALEFVLVDYEKDANKTGDRSK